MPYGPETPPFTEPVPNPPVGPRAAQILEHNIEAAQSTGDTSRAEGYQQQLDDPSTEFPGAPSTGTAPDAADGLIDSEAPAQTEGDAEAQRSANTKGSSANADAHSQSKK